MEVYERSNLVESMWPDWCMIETLRGGTRAMRNASKAYLPQWPAEDDESYRARLNSSFLFNATD